MHEKGRILALMNAAMAAPDVAIVRKTDCPPLLSPPMSETPLSGAGWVASDDDPLPNKRPKGGSTDI